jgi:hypothetical protein
VKKATLAHEAYLRISHIEMEKARKTQESEKARQLVADIAARVQEIEAEKDDLLRAVGERPLSTGLERPERRKKTGSFKIRY